ncbi:hypothetical protein PSCICO_42120 [Pseudomonas cichorii]|uniref:hypothetical protein n=1 Tax=Pseudomonas cichorii TaxID=36746 RepID=UPI00190FFF3F|nr:hypothetical protein [Pseudomonas cichorii]GFM88813.1 hypothetical protein PSCICO_42120 [Pseudomonas cichorii]
MNTSLPNTPSTPDQSGTEGDLDNDPTQNEPEEPSEEKIDHAIEETFPASDPISP